MEYDVALRPLGPVDVIHVPCGGVAFQYLLRPGPGDPIDAKFAVFADGTVPTTGALIVCGVCGHDVRTPEDLRIDGGYDPSPVKRWRIA